MKTNTPEKKPQSLKERKLELKLKVEKEAKADFESFEVFLKKSKSDCILMIKNWISDQAQAYTNVLKCVAQQLPADQLQEIFKELSSTERESWKSELNIFITGRDLVNANKFLAEEVARSKISPFAIKDVQLVDLLLKLNAEIAKDFILKHNDQASLLLNLISAEFSAKLLDSFDEEAASKLIEKSLTFDFDQVKDNFVSFKKVLATFVETKRKMPFNYQLLKMLPGFNPLKEKMLYELLANENMHEELKKQASLNFPSELVFALPKEFLKNVMQKYAMNKKVELLSSLDEEKKNTLMNSFAEVGSASREMLDLEFENLKADPNSQARISGQKDRIWREFISFMREQIATNQEFKGEFEALIADWIDLLSPPTSNARAA